MTEALFVVIGISVGAAAAYLVLSSRFKVVSAKEAFDLQARHSEEVRDIEGRAKAAEALAAELRQQVRDSESDRGRLRSELDAERRQGVETATRLEESYKRLEDSYRNLDEQKALFEVMKKEMSDTFNALSSAALKSSSEDFLRLASEHLGKVVVETKGKLGEHHAAMDATVKPLQELLKRYEQQIKEIEESRHKSFGSLSEQIRSLSSMQERLQEETKNLVTVLRRPKVSGSWGELGLRRVAELAGMTAYCDFYEQESVSAEAGKLRPDMIVRLPNGREIVVDAKAPVDAYLNALSAQSEADRKKGIDNYIQQIRNHMNSLSSKAYWDQFPRSPELVVMYLPGESFFSSALEHDPKLIEDGSIKKIVLATPTTFIALLKAVAYGWQQEQVTKSAQEINRLGRELYERFAVVLEHFARTGAAMRKAVDSYNDGVRSLETRLIPSIRKFKDLGISSAKEAPSPEEIGQTAKTVDHLATEFIDVPEQRRFL
ncbi:MAG TPA: DNA recombination protein RmuC [Dissulfurispiraceae bacterium]|nr:DNA recombination protein RmuC [Dissulfurispiraceae bacterium]